MVCCNKGSHVNVGNNHGPAQNPTTGPTGYTAHYQAGSTHNTYNYHNNRSGHM